MMPARLSELLASLCDAALLTDARRVGPAALQQSWARAHDLVGAVEGTTRVEGREVRVRLGIPARFPNVLPTVFVPDIHARLPHVFIHGYVCYSEHDGVLLDRNDPVGIVADALRRALELVAAGLRGDNAGQFIEELALNWGGEHLGASMLTLGDEIGWVCAVKSPPLWHLFDDRAHAQGVLPGLEAEQVLYVPLLGVPRPIDPFPSGSWSSAEITRFIARNLTREQRKSLHVKLRGSRRSSSAVVVRVPLPRGGACLIGVEYFDICGAHPLTKYPGTANARQIRIVRADRDYLVARGGGLAAVRGCKALLIGCGAVGGHVAGELARAGVQALTLVDPDALRPENAYRHVLGQSLVSRVLGALMGLMPKVTLMEAELHSKYPMLRLAHLAAHIEPALHEGKLRLEDFDLVVVATGDPNVDRSINEFALRLPAAPPIVYTWLEPLGLGGHAALIARHEPGRPRPAGCLDCLFTPAAEERAPTLCNRAAFAAPGQSVTRELAACGNAFTPYGSLDAMRTAELAVRLVLQAMTGEVQGSLLRSWKGDPGEFRRAGHETSSRFQDPAERLEHVGEEFAEPRCPVCGDLFTVRAAAATG